MPWAGFSVFLHNTATAVIAASALSFNEQSQPNGHQKLAVAVVSVRLFVRRDTSMGTPSFKDAVHTYLQFLRLLLRCLPWSP